MASQGIRLVDMVGYAYYHVVYSWHRLWCNQMDIIANTVQDYLVTIASGIEHKKLIAGVRMYFG